MLFVLLILTVRNEIVMKDVTGFKTRADCEAAGKLVQESFTNGPTPRFICIKQ